jgi:hypothetical protein
MMVRADGDVAPGATIEVEVVKLRAGSRSGQTQNESI